MSRYRTLFNGDIVFPKKGNIHPKAPEGFMPDPADPWIMHPIMKECKYRTYKNIPTPCGAKHYVFFCDIDDFVTNYFNCERCERG